MHRFELLLRSAVMLHTLSVRHRFWARVHTGRHSFDGTLIPEVLSHNRSVHGDVGLSHSVLASLQAFEGTTDCQWFAISTASLELVCAERRQVYDLTANTLQLGAYRLAWYPENSVQGICNHSHLLSSLQTFVPARGEVCRLWQSLPTTALLRYLMRTWFEFGLACFVICCAEQK